MTNHSRRVGRLAVVGLGLVFATAPSALRADNVVPDDQIVQGSQCVGLDCVDNESFGFDTLRLKENNTRIGFSDTSTGAGFPNNNWQLTANDSASGGLNKFSIEDITNARIPFTVIANAPTDSIFVDSAGRLGLRTSTPVLAVHAVTSDTPGLRLEQNAGGGFTAQTWDVAGNEANFFVRDVTGGSRLPLRIRPGAPTSAIDVAASGNVGLGTPSPASSLHVFRSDGTAKLSVEETNTTQAGRSLLTLTNNGAVKADFVNTSSGTTWTLTNKAGGFGITSTTATQFFISTSGTVQVPQGTVVIGSSRALKDHIAAVDEAEVLEKLSSLPVSTWRYKRDEGSSHLGPMAEDFYRTFGLGLDDKTIAESDLAGVALAAVKGVQKVLEEKDAELHAVQQENTALAKRLTDLEARVKALSGSPTP